MAYISARATTSTTTTSTPPEVTGSRVGLVTGINIAFIILTTIVIALRVFARVYINRYFGLDDYLICLGALAAFGQGVVVIVGTKYGLGLHSDEIHDFPSKQASFLKVIYSSALIYTFAMLFTKTSILAFYLRLQPSAAATRGFRGAVYGLVFFVVGVSLASMFTISFQCSPVAYAWDLSLNGTCINRIVYYHFNSGLNILGDIGVYFLSIPLVRAVKLPARQRRGLYVVLGLGCFVCVSGVIRMYTLHKVNHTVDSTWALIDPFNWSTIEANIGILCACIPSFKIIINRYWPRCLTKESTGQASGSGDSELPDIELAKRNKPGPRSPHFLTTTDDHDEESGGPSNVEPVRSNTADISILEDHNCSQEHIIKPEEHRSPCQ